MSNLRPSNHRRGLRRRRPSSVYRRGTSRRVHRVSGCLLRLMLVGGGLGLIAAWLWSGGRLTPYGPSYPPGLLGSAYQAFDAGDLDRAVQLAQRVYAGSPDRHDALLLLVRSLIYRSYSDYDRAPDRALALQAASNAVDRDPYNVDALAAYALALHSADLPVEAARSAQRALLRDPDHVPARVAMALAYAGAGVFEAGLREADASLTLSQAPDSPWHTWQLDALRARAVILGDLGRYREAADTADAALRIQPTLPLLHYERALFALQMGDTGAATVAYFEILAQTPDNAKATLRLCEVSSLLREADPALAYCQEAVRLAPGWADAWYRLGREHYLLGDFSAAQQSLARCAQLQAAQQVPAEARIFECWYLQGQAAEALGDCDGLYAAYSAFQDAAAQADLPQTWTYPPEGPPGCPFPASAAGGG